jgi:phosphate transport system substrate-binding protein
VLFSLTRLPALICPPTAAVALLLTGLMALTHTSHADTVNLVIKGSTTILPIAQSIAEEFERQCPDTKVQVSGGGSAEGITALIMGEADIATSSTFITEEELKLARQHDVYPVPFRIANDCILPVVHNSNPLRNISRDDLKDIYLGLINNWKQLGGPDLAIDAVSRDKASGTFEVWHHLIMNMEPVVTDVPPKHSSADVVREVANNPRAIGYIGLGYLSANVKPLRVDGIIGSQQTLLDGTYPIHRPLFMFTNGWPSGKTLEFINFVLDANMGQVLIEEAEYIPLYR